MLHCPGRQTRSFRNTLCTSFLALREKVIQKTPKRGVHAQQWELAIRKVTILYCAVLVHTSHPIAACHIGPTPYSETGVGISSVTRVVVTPFRRQRKQVGFHTIKKTPSSTTDASTHTTEATACAQRITIHPPPPVRADGRLPAYLSDFPEPNLLRREPDQRPSTAETTHTLPSSAIKGNFRA